MAELDTITVRGFKSIAALDKVQLRPINILIGPNGSGKSNFIGIFAFLNAIRQGHLEEYVIRAGGAEKILHFGSKKTESLRIHISFADGRYQYQIDLHPTENDGLLPFKETVYFWDRERFPEDPPYAENVTRAGIEAGISAQNSSKIVRYVGNRLDSWRLYHFHDTSFSSPMKKTSDINDNRYLRPDGSNLAAFLYYLQEKHEASYSLIRRSVQIVAPFFADFQLEPQRLNPDKIRLEWKHKGTSDYFDASSLSDGTLRFMALATLFLQPDIYQPSVILADEPELGLHPYALSMLAAMVKQASVHTQVILSTQSPFLLDHFEPEDVLVTERIAGGTHFRRLEFEPLAAWLEEYSLGQLWEKNELGGRPGGE